MKLVRIHAYEVTPHAGREAKHREVVRFSQIQRF